MRTVRYIHSERRSNFCIPRDNHLLEVCYLWRLTLAELVLDAAECPIATEHIPAFHDRPSCGENSRPTPQISLQDLQTG